MSQAIGDGNIPVHFNHKRTHYKHEEGIVQYTFAINGVDFKTGWHDQVDCDFLDGVNGYLVPARDALALGETIDSLLDDPQRLCSMGQAARRMAEEKFSMERVNQLVISTLGLAELRPSVAV
ncbi:MAG: hypothetical protein EBZ48_02915 [Proteobacteria bacterium]|nr:hypothetical protein [Pseudomonadota bacterium]